MNLRATKNSFLGALKKAQKCEEKDIFDVAASGSLDGATEGALKQDALSNLYKVVRKGAFEFSLKGTLEVPLFGALINTKKFTK